MEVKDIRSNEFEKTLAQIRAITKNLAKNGAVMPFSIVLSEWTKAKNLVVTQIEKLDVLQDQEDIKMLQDVKVLLVAEEKAAKQRMQKQMRSSGVVRLTNTLKSRSQS